MNEGAYVCEDVRVGMGMIVQCEYANTRRGYENGRK